ncbi:MAG: methyl-accepting chemotaxis protein [Lachnospiraceae bacterium]|nr:methyl-accepting chemotaxis protein [Lachnospiraceae bacterium]
MNKQEIKNPLLKRSIGKTLLMVILPVVAIGLITIIVILNSQASKSMTTSSKSGLESEAGKNSAEISSEVMTIISAYNQFVETLETVPFADTNAMNAYLAPSMEISPMAKNGVYGGLEDGTWIDPSGWTPDADYVITEKDWYKQGKESEEFVFGAPYVDDSTGKMVVSASRKVTLADGRTGVMAVDIDLEEIVNTVSAYTPLGYGKSMLLDGEFILTYINEEYNGTSASDHADDEFLTQIAGHTNAKDTGVYNIKDGNTTYIVAISDVPGTTWSLISTVDEKLVLADSVRFRNIAVIFMIIVLLVIVAIVLLAVRRIISKPVNNLTHSITQVSNGDFTATMPSSNGDEIGLISSEMSHYVEKMKATIIDIQNRATQLKTDSNSSKDASNFMTEEANTQSISMNQIQEAMDGIAHAVTDLAENATDLAQSVDELTRKGNSTNDVMKELVKQADVGQRDMTNVKNTMTDISSSMGEMNDVVNVVRESADKINEIVEMIDSIASQTNLLSLNASIEAARAGEAGRGFAVVADEIGNLATNSQNAAQEIAGIIGEITSEIGTLSEKSQDNMGAIENSSEAVEKAGESFHKIFGDLNSAADTMQSMIGMMDDVNEIAANVAAISEEQSASTEEVMATVEELAKSAEDIADTSQNVEHAANSVSDSAVSINEALSQFKID